MTNKENIVITGMGAITPLGLSMEEICDNLQKARPIKTDITLFDCSGFATKQASELSSFQGSQYLGEKGLRFIPRSGQLLMSALSLLAKDANIPADEVGKWNCGDSKIGLVLGNTFGSLESISSFDREAMVNPQYVNPMAIPNTVMNAIAGYAAIRYGIRCFTITVSNGFVSGTDALGLAAEMLLANRADFICAGGVEELCCPLVAGFERGGMSGHTWLGEGCVMFAVERESSAQKRTARILGEISGYDSRFNPDVKVGLNAGLDALESSGVDVRGIPWALISPNETIAALQREVIQKRMSAIILDALNQTNGDSYSAQGALQAAAVLADPRIKPGETALLSTAGFDGGVSFIALKKR